MTAILLAFAALAAGAPATDFDHAHMQFNTVLSSHVGKGLVDYAGLKEDRDALDAYLKDSGAISLSLFQSWTKDEQLAFLLNLYNATTLQLIIDHYPVDSIKDIGSLFTSPWEKKTVLLFGKRVSLDTLEHKIIRKNYKEPRIHFALVCAAMGCPPLRNEPYRAATLDAQLDDQSRIFLNTPAKNRVDSHEKELRLSPLFKWYGEDFGDGADALKAFVFPYIKVPIDELDTYDVEFTDYDWSLNDQAADGR